MASRRGISLAAKIAGALVAAAAALLFGAQGPAAEQQVEKLVDERVVAGQRVARQHRTGHALQQPRL